MQLPLTSPLVCMAQLLENSCCIAENRCVEQVKKKGGGGGVTDKKDGVGGNSL